MTVENAIVGKLVKIGFSIEGESQVGGFRLSAGQCELTSVKIMSETSLR